MIDQTMGAITTSEGQAYALLRALWVGDERSFRVLREWTLNNLQGGEPGQLPAWRWGQAEDGTWGVIDPQPASDADVLLAWVLLGAAHRWEEPSWRDHALALLSEIWTKETMEIGGRRVLLPGPWAKDMSPVWINPSYFMPFAFRDFARVNPYVPTPYAAPPYVPPADVPTTPVPSPQPDPVGTSPAEPPAASNLEGPEANAPLPAAAQSPDWLRLVDSSYAVLDEVMPARGLPPDWCFFDPVTGARVAPPEGEAHREDFGFEALRISWILAAESEWHDEARADTLLDRLDGLAERFARDGLLPGLIMPDGTARVTWESRSLYATLIPVWGRRHPELLDALRRRMDELAVQPPRGPQQGRDYYAANWVWFGEALEGDLPRPVELP